MSWVREEEKSFFTIIPGFGRGGESAGRIGREKFNHTNSVIGKMLLRAVNIVKAVILKIAVAGNAGCGTYGQMRGC